MKDNNDELEAVDMDKASGIAAELGGLIGMIRPDNVEPELETVAKGASCPEAGISVGGAMRGTRDNEPNFAGPVKRGVLKFGQ